MMGRLKTQEEFEKEVTEIFGDKFTYNKLNYVNTHTQVTMTCKKHGDFEVVPYKLLNRRTACKECKKEERIEKSRRSFLTRANKVHNNFYTYPNLSFKKKSEYVDILCPDHGLFKQQAIEHQRGGRCPDCWKEDFAKDRSYTTKDFIKVSKNKHPHKFTYEDVDYVNNRVFILLTCKKHGKFKVTPSSHLHNKYGGCKDCYKDSYLTEDRSGWTYTAWKKAGQASNYFDSYKLYIIKTDKFYKIGRTYNTIKHRFSCSGFPYDYKIIHVIKGEAREICEIERLYLNLCSDFRYEPKKDFIGQYECFSSIDPILKFLS